MAEKTIIEVTCPVCKETKVLSFDPEYLEDPAFAACAKDPKWKAPCDKCHELSKEFCEWHGMDEDETNDFLDVMLGGCPDSIEALKEYKRFITA